VSFVSRLAYCLLEVDSRFELVVSDSARPPTSFPVNGALHPSQQFLTYVELPSAGECGSFSEFVQWRRRVCELRARGWGYCHSAAGGEQQSAEGGRWRVDRFNAIARDQSRKNFTPFPGSGTGSGEAAGLSDISELRARLLKETESKGVQLMLGNAPTQLDWRPHLATTEPATALSVTGPTAASCSALVRFLCLMFGALRRGGDFAFLLTGASHSLQSPFVQSALRVLAGCFSLLTLHHCAVTAGVYGSDEVWLVGKGFVAGHADEGSERLRAACAKLLTETGDAENATERLSNKRLQPAGEATSDSEAGAELLSARVRAMEDWSDGRQTVATRPQLPRTATHLALPTVCVCAVSVLSRALHATACLCLTDEPLESSSDTAAVSSFRPPSVRSHCASLLATWGMQLVA